eukprot:scaffold16043_cov115-Isochrysis_galbana.AAC.17
MTWGGGGACAVAVCARQLRGESRPRRPVGECAVAPRACDISVTRARASARGSAMHNHEITNHPRWATAVAHRT